MRLCHCLKWPSSVHVSRGSDPVLGDEAGPRLGQWGREPGTRLCEQCKAQGFEIHYSSIAHTCVIPEMSIFSLTRTLVLLGGEFFSLILLFLFFNTWNASRKLEKLYESQENYETLFIWIYFIVFECCVFTGKNVFISSMVLEDHWKICFHPWVEIFCVLNASVLSRSKESQTEADIAGTGWSLDHQSSWAEPSQRCP